MATIEIPQVKDTLPKIATGLKKYISLQDRFHNVNVSENRQFQEDYTGFFGMHWKSEEFRAAYFRFMEERKHDMGLTFDSVLNHLHGIEGSVEASFASKLLAMVKPDMPVLDSHVRENLGIEKPAWCANPQTRIEHGIAIYQAIREWYKNHFKSGEAAEWLKLFDEHYPDAKGKISDVKKIDLILWQIRD